MHTNTTLWAFFLLHLIGGHLALPTLLLIAWARESVGRNLVFYNFVFTWILYSATFCLLWVIPTCRAHAAGGLTRLGRASRSSWVTGCMRISTSVLNLIECFASFSRRWCTRFRCCECVSDLVEAVGLTVERETESLRPYGHWYSRCVTWSTGGIDTDPFGLALAGGSHTSANSRR
jgi:hypothetical protein